MNRSSTKRNVVHNVMVEDYVFRVAKAKAAFALRELGEDVEPYVALLTPDRVSSRPVNRSAKISFSPKTWLKIADVAESCGVSKGQVVNSILLSYIGGDGWTRN